MKTRTAFLALSLLSSAANADPRQGECLVDGAILNISGTSATLSAELANGKMTYMSAIKFPVPICIKSDFEEDPDRDVTKLVIPEGLSMKDGTPVSVRGKLSTDNVTQHYPYPNALVEVKVVPQAKAAAPASPDYTPRPSRQTEINSATQCVQYYDRVIQMQRRIGAEVGVVDRAALYQAGMNKVACSDRLQRLTSCKSSDCSK